MKIQIRFSITNILIILSAIATLLAHFIPNIYIFGINNNFLNEGLYYIYFIQFFTGTFLHLNFGHFLTNSLFLFIFGNMVEGIIGKNKFIIFFIFATIFDGIGLSLFSAGNTIGISGFCMALISYYTLELKSRNDMDYKGGITALILNIMIGLVPGISLLGHFFGAIAGVIYYLFNKDFFREKWVGIFNIEKS